MEFINYEVIVNLITLTVLEIVLGIDNLIFIAIAIHKLPNHLRKKARIFGLSMALGIRIVMLCMLSFIMGLTKPIFTISTLEFSWKDILLIAGGLFLIVKSGLEIYNDTFGEAKEQKETKMKVRDSLMSAIFQITLVDFVFSFDSIITAVGITRDMPNNIAIIVVAVVISMIVMLLASESISKFLAKYPSIKIIALAFIFMIGVILLADGFSIDIPKAYMYFALFFTIAVESLNIIAGKRK